jgi:hypothetical protein
MIRRFKALALKADHFRNGSSPKAEKLEAKRKGLAQIPPRERPVLCLVRRSRFEHRKTIWRYKAVSPWGTLRRCSMPMP